MKRVHTPAAAAVAAVPRPPRAVMSFDEYIGWLDEDTFAEWEDGEVVLMSPASLRHQLILSFLSALLGQFVEQRQAGIAVPAPFPMQLAQIRRGREPDLLFVAKENLDRLSESQLKGPADLVMEIVSPESRVRDRHIKYGEYAAASVPEYWLIDPMAHTVEVFWLATPGEYQRIEADDAGRLRSRVLPGFWLQPSWLWMEPLPSAVDKLTAIAGRAM